MKQIFWFVVAINIVFFAWNSFFRASPSDPSSSAVTADSPERKSILLLSERLASPPPTPPSPSAGVAGMNRQPTPASRDEAAVATCYAVGPFQRTEDATGAVMQLKDHALQARLRKSDERASTGYLVFMPPLADRNEARRILREMHQQNIDSFIVTKGARTNAISVGLYTDRAEAEARRDELRGKGFDVTIEERVSAKTEYWVDVEASSETGNVMSEIEKALGSQMSGMRLERVRCSQG